MGTPNADFHEFPTEVFAGFGILIVLMVVGIVVYDHFMEKNTRKLKAARDKDMKAASLKKVM